MAKIAPLSSAVCEVVSMMFSPKLFWAKAERSTVASVSTTSATK